MSLEGSAQDLPHRHTHIVGEGIGCDPHDGLPEHLSLVVNAFDGQEDLRGERGADNVVTNTGDRGGAGRLSGPQLTLRRARAAMI